MDFSAIQRQSGKPPAGTGCPTHQPTGDCDSVFRQWRPALIQMNIFKADWQILLLMLQRKLPCLKTCSHIVRSGYVIVKAAGTRFKHPVKLQH